MVESYVGSEHLSLSSRGWFAAFSYMDCCAGNQGRGLTLNPKPNRSDVRYQNLMRNCEVRYQASTTTTTSQIWADHADPNFIPGSLSEYYCLAREYGRRTPSSVLAGDPVFTAWRTSLQPRPYQVVFRTRLIPLTTALRNPTRRGFTGVGDAIFQSDLFSCQAVRASAEREDGSFPLMSSKCGKAYYSVPHLWKHTSLDDPSLEPWLDRLEKDTVFPVSDIYQVGTSSIQSARIFTIRVAGLEWEIEGRKKTAASCPVLLLEKDCQASCYSVCESVLLTGEYPRISKVSGLVIAGNLTLKSSRSTLPVARLKSVTSAERKEVESGKRCPHAATFQEYLPRSRSCRSSSFVSVPWNEVASAIGITSRSTFRANLGETREVTWSQAFGEAGLATAMFGAFVAPLAVEAVFNLKRGTAPRRVTALSVVVWLIGISQLGISLSPLVGVWKIVFYIGCFVVINEASHCGPSLFELLCAGTGIALAGTARSVDSGWLLTVRGTASNLFLALGGALSTTVSLGAAVSTCLHLQQSQVGGTVLHNLMSSPSAAQVLIRAWATYTGESNDWEDEGSEETPAALYLFFILSSLISRYALVAGYLSFVLPTSPFVLDKQGRVKRAVIAAIFSSLKEETQTMPARVLILFLLALVGNPMLTIAIAVALLASHEENLVQINQATYQAIVASLLASDAMPVQTASGSGLTDSIVQSFDAYPTSVSDAIVTALSPLDTSAGGDDLMVRTVVANLLKEHGLASSTIDDFMHLAHSCKMSVVVRGTGHTLAHLTVHGGQTLVSYHVVTGPKCELGDLAVGEQFAIIKNGQVMMLQVVRVPEKVALGTTGLVDGILLIGDAMSSAAKPPHQAEFFGFGSRPFTGTAKMMMTSAKGSEVQAYEIPREERITYKEPQEPLDSSRRRVSRLSPLMSDDLGQMRSV